MFELMKDLWGFLRVRKKFWLLPIVLIMLLLATLIIISQSTVVAPLIYTIF